MRRYRVRRISGSDMPYYILDITSQLLDIIIQVFDISSFKLFRHEYQPLIMIRALENHFENFYVGMLLYKGWLSVNEICMLVSEV